MKSLFERILESRGLSGKSKAAFLSPDYLKSYDPFRLNDMNKAVDRLVAARKKQEKIVIYGDYDIDGLTATTLLLDAFNSFGYENVDVFIPNRFVEGYGLTVDAIETIANDGAKLIVTVDSGSTSEKEIIRANELGVDVIVTDHHVVGKTLPPAVAVINPKRLDGKYPFTELAGVGVAFKLVQALQTKIDGIDAGQEKWLLDLVALGTVCDIVDLVDENRTNVFWGLKVLSRTKRPGLKALMAISGIDPQNLNARSLGFGLGPRMNAAGRLETAQYALDMLIATDPMLALEKAEHLDAMNKSRRSDQDTICKEAFLQAEKYSNDPVLVLSDPTWNHGIVGIVASKLMEKYKKPAFVFQELGEESKGSARSYGDFSAIDAVNATRDIIAKGGGHEFAAGITLPTKDIGLFREKVNGFYKSLNLFNQASLLLPSEDTVAEFSELNEEVIELINQLEPFGTGNPKPVLKSCNLQVIDTKKMGANSQHIKLNLRDESGNNLQFIMFNAPESYFVDIGSKINAWYHLSINEWRGVRSIEGQLLHLEPTG